MNPGKHHIIFAGINFLLFFFLIIIVHAQTPPDRLLLKNYRPKSIYKIPISNIQRAKYPIIDLHSHPYAETPEQIAQWVKIWTRSASRKRSF